MARRLAHSIYVGLKAATRAMIDGAFGRQKIAADATRVDQQAISEYGSIAKMDRFMPVDVLADLIDASGDLTLLKALADASGCLLVQLPGGALDSELAARTGQSAKEFGDVMVRIGDALRDGKIDEMEGRRIALEIREAMMELASLAEAVKAASERDTP